MLPLSWCAKNNNLNLFLHQTRWLLFFTSFLPPCILCKLCHFECWIISIRKHHLTLVLILVGCAILCLYTQNMLLFYWMCTEGRTHILLYIFRFSLKILIFIIFFQKFCFTMVKIERFQWKKYVLHLFGLKRKNFGEIKIRKMMLKIQRKKINLSNF